MVTMDDEDNFMDELFLKLQSSFVSPKTSGSVESLRTSSSFEFNHDSADTSYCSQCSSCGTSPRNNIVKSSIVFHQKPILPPLLCATYRQEMRTYRDKAAMRDEHRKSAEKQRLITRVEAILSSVKFTPKAKKEDTAHDMIDQNNVVQPSSDEEKTDSTVIEVDKNENTPSLDGAVETLVSEVIDSAKRKLTNDFNHSSITDHELERSETQYDAENENETTECETVLSPDKDEDKTTSLNIDSLSPIQLQGSVENETLNQTTSTKVCLKDFSFATIPPVATGTVEDEVETQQDDTLVNSIENPPTNKPILDHAEQISQNPIFMSTSEAEDTTIAESCSVPMGTTSDSDVTMLHGQLSDADTDVTIKSQQGGAGDAFVSKQHRRRGSYTLDKPSPFLIRDKEKHTVSTDESCSDEGNLTVSRKLNMDSEWEDSSIKTGSEGSDCSSLKSRLQLIHRKQLSKLQLQHKQQMADIQMKLLKNQQVMEKSSSDLQSVASEDSLLPLDVRRDVSFLQLPKIALTKTPPPSGANEQLSVEVYSPENERIDSSVYAIQKKSTKMLSHEAIPQKLQSHKDKAPTLLTTYKQMEPTLHVKFCKLSALVKGHLTRCLLATPRVQSVMEKVRDTTCLILAIHEDKSSVTKSVEDDQLQERLFSQFFDLLGEIHHIFFNTDISYRMKLISASEATIIRKMKQKQPIKSPRTLSAATKKSMERKQRQQCESTRPSSAKRRTEVRSRISHIWKESKVLVAEAKSEPTVTKTKQETGKVTRIKPKVNSNSAKTIKPDAKQPAGGGSKSKIIRKKAPLSTRNAIK